MENGNFSVDLLAAKKPVFILTSATTARRWRRTARQRVLDAFCYSGGFGIAAGLAGAREIVFVDSSHAALELTQDNADRNNLAGKYTCVEGDAFALLAAEPIGGPFDVIFDRSSGLRAFQETSAHGVKSLRETQCARDEVLKARRHPGQFVLFPSRRPRTLHARCSAAPPQSRSAPSA